VDQKEAKKSEADKAKDVAEPKKYPSKQRGRVPSDFYNEIVHSDDETIDTGKATGCCKKEGLS